MQYLYTYMEWMHITFVHTYNNYIHVFKIEMAQIYNERLYAALFAYLFV